MVRKVKQPSINLFTLKCKTVDLQLNDSLFKTTKTLTTNITFAGNKSLTDGDSWSLTHLQIVMRCQSWSVCLNAPTAPHRYLFQIARMQATPGKSATLPGQRF